MTSKWTYLSRTMHHIGFSLMPLEMIIRTKLIPALTGRPPPNEQERDFLALPARSYSYSIAEYSELSCSVAKERWPLINT